MNKQSYKLTFLPLFEEDLLKVTDYINQYATKSQCGLPFS